MHILLVEEDLKSRIKLVHLLESWGHTVEECDNGFEAVKKFSRGYFQLVLSEVKLSQIDGLKLVKLLKSLEVKNPFEIILFTESYDIKTAIEAFREGANDYLLKPLSISDLDNALKRVLQRHEMLTDKQEYRIIICDDFLSREGIKAIFRHYANNFIVVGETSSVNNVLRLIDKNAPDLLFVDYTFAERDNILALCKTVKATYPGIKIFVLASQGNKRAAKEIIGAGANGFIIKQSLKQADNFLELVNMITEGKIYVDPELKKNNWHPMHADCAAVETLLTDKEFLVLRCLAEGKNNRQIAEQLFISCSTVRNYISSILNKLHLTDRASAIVYAVKYFSNI
ncbi:response regulator [Zhaonella formicivorans]|uniref:response regulator n=1 Tax=Zhaonella formicivorans TaxID=2528593 RepID=UPI0010E532BD|nr:response regulator [Zhaonella formicivorans]